MNKISSLFGRRGFGTKWGQLVVPIPDTKKVSNLHKAIKFFWLHPPPVALSLKLPPLDISSICYYGGVTCCCYLEIFPSKYNICVESSNLIDRPC